MFYVQQGRHGFWHKGQVKIDRKGEVYHDDELIGRLCETREDADEMMKRLKEKKRGVVNRIREC